MKWRGSIKAVMAVGLCVHWSWITLHGIYIWKSLLCKEKSVRLFTLSTPDQCRGTRGGRLKWAGGLYWCHLLYRDLPLSINIPRIPTKQHPIKQRNHNWPWAQGACWWKHCEAWCDSQWATSQAVTSPPIVMWDLTYICADLHGHLWQALFSITVLGLKCGTPRKPKWAAAVTAQAQRAGQKRYDWKKCILLERQKKQNEWIHIL